MQMKPTAPLSGGDAVRTASENGHHHSPGVYGPSGRSPWLDVDWREHQRWVSVDGQPVNTIDLGEGPPIVFVHGLAGSWPNWLEQLPMFTPGPPIVFVHGLAGSWPNWLEQLPMFTPGPPIVFVHGLAGSWPNWLEQLPMFTPGPPIVFVHGLAGSWPNWLEQLGWDDARTEREIERFAAESHAEGNRPDGDPVEGVRAEGVRPA